jgi:hypothetical protein
VTARDQGHLVELLLQNPDISANADKFLRHYFDPSIDLVKAQVDIMPELRSFGLDLVKSRTHFSAKSRDFGV